jgi:hypothetical protein
LINIKIKTLKFKIIIQSIYSTCLLMGRELIYHILLYLDAKFERPEIISELNEYFQNALLYQFDLNKRDNDFIKKWAQV